MSELPLNKFLEAREEGRQAEREHIRKNIMNRVTDLKSCGSSNCNCQEFAELILSYLDDEWLA